MTSTSSVGVCHTPSDRLQEYIVELKVDALHAAVEKRMLAVDPRASVITRAGGVSTSHRSCVSPTPDARIAVVGGRRVR